MIRKFKLDDIDEVMHIWLDANLKVHNFIKSGHWKDNYNYVKEALPGAEVYVYLIDDEIVGFIGLNNNYIEGLFVHQSFQGKGVGTSLLNKAKENQGTLSLNVYKKNKDAIKFYTKNGFRITYEKFDDSVKEIEYLMNWVK